MHYISPRLFYLLTYFPHFQFTDVLATRDLGTEILNDLCMIGMIVEVEVIFGLDYVCRSRELDVD